MRRAQLAAEFAGYGCLAAAMFLIAVPLGLLILGVGLVAAGNMKVR